MPIDVLDIIKKRRSVKEYSSKMVPNNTISRILEGARWAPSSHNAQPWRFIVIRDSAVKNRLFKDMASRWAMDMNENGIPKEQRENLMKTSVERFENAPIAIVVCLTMEDMEEYPDEQRRRVEYIMSVQSVAAAIENLLIAAEDEGLGTCWYCAPLFCQDVVRKSLEIPQHVDPQALITLGYSAEKPKTPPRKALEEIIYQDRWGQMT